MSIHSDWQIKKCGDWKGVLAEKTSANSEKEKCLGSAFCGVGSSLIYNQPKGEENVVLGNGLKPIWVRDTEFWVLAILDVISKVDKFRVGISF